MPRYDLAGNPLPDDDQPKYGQPGAPGGPAYGGQPPRYDLAGNPIAPAPSGAAPYPGAAAPPPGAYAPRPGAAPMPPYSPPGAGSYPPPGVGGYPPPPGQGGGYPPPGAYPTAQPPGAGQYGGYAQPVAVSSDDNSKKVVTFGIIAGVVVIALVAFAVANAPHALPATTAFSHYVDPFKQFNCDQPQDWDVISAEQIGGQDVDPSVDVGGVIFRKFGAKVDITTDVVTKLTANMLMAPGDGSQALGGSKLPELDKETYNRVKNSYSQYTEVNATSIDTGFGEAKAYEFTAGGPKFGIPVATHGYIVEMVGGTHSCVLVATAPESDWTNAKPVFDRIVGSIAEGASAPQPIQLSPADSGSPAQTSNGQSNQPTGNLSSPSSIAAPATNAAGSYGIGQ